MGNHLLEVSQHLIDEWDCPNLTLLAVTRKEGALMY